LCDRSLQRFQPCLSGRVVVVLGVVVVVTMIGGTVTVVGGIIGGILTVVGTIPVGTSEGDDAAGGVPASPRNAPLALAPVGGPVAGTGRVVAVVVASVVLVLGLVLVLVLVSVLVLVLALVLGTVKDTGGARAERATGPISIIAKAVAAPVK
jgi:hypothetical protein